MCGGGAPVGNAEEPLTYLSCICLSLENHNLQCTRGVLIERWSEKCDWLDTAGGLYCCSLLLCSCILLLPMVLGLSNLVVSLFFILVLRSDDNGTCFFFVFLSLLGKLLLLHFLHSISNQQVKAEQERAKKKSTKSAMVKDEDQCTHLVGLSMKAIGQFASDPALSCDLPTIWATQYLMVAGWCAKACSGPLGGRSGSQYSFLPIL